MQRFFTDTIESRFVKHILHEIFLPIIDTVSDGDYVFKDKFYVYKQSLLQCRKSGYLFPQKSSNKDSIPYSEPIADVMVKETYIPYTMYPKYCNRFISKNVFYDTETHKRLGKYLRFFRDIYDIDLMPFYNCYAGETVNNIDISPANGNKNLLNPLWWRHTNPYTIDGITWTLNDDGSVTADGEATADSEAGFLIERELNGNYYFAGNLDVPSSVADLYMYDATEHARCKKWDGVTGSDSSTSDANLQEVQLNDTNVIEMTCRIRNGQTVDNLRFEPTILASTSEETTYSYNYSPQLKTYKIPIKFNKKYTIAIDAPSEVIVAPCILFKGNLETINGVDLNTLPTQGESNPLCSYSKRYYDLSFKKPILFELPCDNVTLYEHQKDLSLLIQVPISNNSSMVVLEGDYVDLDVNVIFNLDGYHELNDKDMNNALISNLHLLQINDGVRYAFSDRLIEYLVRNVITPRDRLGMNIQRVQQSGLNMTYPNTYLGVWFPEMRYILYRKYMNDSSTNKLDINGFVDVNIEKYINKIGQ